MAGNSNLMLNFGGILIRPQKRENHVARGASSRVLASMYYVHGARPVAITNEFAMAKNSVNSDKSSANPLPDQRD